MEAHGEGNVGDTAGDMGHLTTHRTLQCPMEDVEGHAFHLRAVQQEGHSPAQSSRCSLGAPDEQVDQCHVQSGRTQGAPPCPRITPQQCCQNRVWGRGGALLAKG